MERIRSLLSETLDKYEGYRLQARNQDWVNIQNLQNRIETTFQDTINSIPFKNITVKTNKGMGQPPILDNFNIIFLEKQHEISRGIYCGIGFLQGTPNFELFLSTSIKNTPAKNIWEQPFTEVFNILKEFGWIIPCDDPKHYWRYFSKIYNISKFDNEAYEDFFISIKVVIRCVRLLISQYPEYTKSFLNKNDIITYDIHNINEQITLLKNEIKRTDSQKKIDYETETTATILEDSHENINPNPPSPVYEIEAADLEGCETENEPAIPVDFEGTQRSITHTIYERMPRLRKFCINHYTVKGRIECQVCGFDFASVYGSLGEGFIEIHHKTPLSKLYKPTEINPIEDLIPVCSNCHRMIHRHTEALTIEELTNTLKK